MGGYIDLSWCCEGGEGDQGWLEDWEYVGRENKHNKDNNNGLLAWCKAMDGAGGRAHEHKWPAIGAHGQWTRPMALVFCWHALITFNEAEINI